MRFIFFDVTEPQASSKIRQQILCQNFSDFGDKAHLVSVSRIFATDKNNDNNLATELAPDFSDSESNNSNDQLTRYDNTSINNSHHHNNTNFYPETDLNAKNNQPKQHPVISLPAQTGKKDIFLLNQIRNVFYMSTVHRRKLLSAITLLVLVSIFCVISTSIVDVLISSSQIEHENKYSSYKG